MSWRQFDPKKVEAIHTYLTACVLNEAPLPDGGKIIGLKEQLLVILQKIQVSGLPENHSEPLDFLGQLLDGKVHKEDRSGRSVTFTFLTPRDVVFLREHFGKKYPEAKIEVFRLDMKVMKVFLTAVNNQSDLYKVFPELGANPEKWTLEKLSHLKPNKVAKIFCGGDFGLAYQITDEVCSLMTKKVVHPTMSTEHNASSAHNTAVSSAEHDALSAHNTAMSSAEHDAPSAQRNVNEKRRHDAFQQWLQEDEVCLSLPEIKQFCPQLRHFWKFDTFAKRTIDELMDICQGDIGLAYELHHRARVALSRGEISVDKI